MIEKVQDNPARCATIVDMTETPQEVLEAVRSKNLESYDGIGQFICKLCSRKWGNLSGGEKSALEEHLGFPPEDDDVMLMLQVALETSPRVAVADRFVRAAGKRGDRWYGKERLKEEFKAGYKPPVDANTPIVADAVRKATIQSLMDAGMSRDEAEAAAEKI